MKEVLAISAIAFLFGIADASAEIRPTGINILQSSKIHLAYYYSRRRGRYLHTRGRHIHTFPSGQRYASRGGPYIRYVLPGSRRTGPIARDANP